MSYPSGRHFLQIPGPTTFPDRVLVDVVASDWGHGANPTAPPSAIRTC
jgi:hypothetical protein